MAFVIEKAEKISVTTTAKDVNIGFRSFLIKNVGEKTVYFKEKDGIAVTVDNGFALGPGEMIPFALSAKVLSIKGEAASTVSVMYGREE